MGWVGVQSYKPGETQGAGEGRWWVCLMEPAKGEGRGKLRVHDPVVSTKHLRIETSLCKADRNGGILLQLQWWAPNPCPLHLFPPAESTLKLQVTHWGHISILTLGKLAENRERSWWPRISGRVGSKAWKWWFYIGCLFILLRVPSRQWSQPSRFREPRGQHRPLWSIPSPAGSDVSDSQDPSLM